MKRWELTILEKKMKGKNTNSVLSRKKTRFNDIDYRKGVLCPEINYTKILLCLWVRQCLLCLWNCSILYSKRNLNHIL